eukprot:COSAG01_NODE_6655_length_3561_cov_2.145292_2_plen_57_part_00
MRWDDESVTLSVHALNGALSELGLAALGPLQPAAFQRDDGLKLSEDLNRAPALPHG